MENRASLLLKPFDREFDRDIEVESRTGSQSYTVNLYRYTCTCPDFLERRSKVSCRTPGTQLQASERHCIGYYYRES